MRIVRHNARVVHLTSLHPGLDVRIFYKECRSLAGAGYDVFLVAPHPREDTIDGVRLIAIPRIGRRFRRMTITMTQVYRKAMQLNADLYHMHDPELIPMGLLLRARGKQVIYDIHEDVPRDLLTRDYLPDSTKCSVCWFVEQLENFSARHFSGLVAATPAIGARFRTFNPRTLVVNNYPLNGEFKLSDRSSWQGRGKAVAYVGGIAVERGIIQMVEAMEYLPRVLGVTLELAGEFSSSGHRNHVLGMRGWTYVNERGMLNRTEVAHLLSRVCVGLVLFHPKPNNVQARPNKLFEYMSAGIPVVASDFPFWRELVEQVGCGLLVDPLDSKAIAGAIEYLLTHPFEAEAMGQRGRDAVEKCYNWDTEAAKLIKLYADILNNK